MNRRSTVPLALLALAAATLVPLGALAGIGISGASPLAASSGEGDGILCELRGASPVPCNYWASRLPMGPSNEVHVAVNPLDPNHLLVVGKDYGLGSYNGCRPSGAWHVASSSYVTFDGGATWTTARVPAPYPLGGGSPSPLPYVCGSDPVAAFGPDGTAYYILLNFDYVGPRHGAIGVAKSPDGGRTWPASGVRLLHTSGGDDKQWGAVDAAGRVHVVWSDLSQGRVLYSRSDASFAFSTPRVLFTIGGGNPGVLVVPGVDNEVYVVWRDSSSIKFMKSADGGATFAPARVAFATTPYETGGPPRLPFMPQAAIDTGADSPFRGRIYVTWPDARLGDSSVWMSSSGDDGATWTLPKRVDDNTVANKRQVLPTVSVAPNGRVDVAWMDERVGAQVTGVYMPFSAFSSSSLDAGASWAANTMVSEVPLNAYWSPHQDGSVFIGDYMGIASTNEAAWPTFPGNGLDRAGVLPPDKLDRADAYVARVPGGAPAADAQAPIGVLPSVEVGDVPFGTPGEDVPHVLVDAVE